MGSFSIWHWIIVLLIVLLLFGAGKLPTVMGDIAKGIKAFKAGLKDPDEEETPPAAPPAVTTPPAATAQAATVQTDAAAATPTDTATQAPPVQPASPAAAPVEMAEPVKPAPGPVHGVPGTPHQG